MQTNPPPISCAPQSVPLAAAPRAAWQERDGFAALYAQFGPRLFRFCLRLTGGKTDEAEDLAQEVFVAAFQKPTWDGRAKLTTWLFKIAVYRWQAQNRRPQPEPLTDAQRETLPAPGVALDAAQNVRMDSQAALFQLTAHEREAFLLVKSEGLTTREAAQILDVPQGTVKFRVFSAIKKLQRSLSDEREGGNPN